VIASNAARRLEQRRNELIALSRLQREQLVAEIGAIRHRLAPLERGARALRAIKTHPLILVAITLGVLLYRPRRTFRLIGRAIALYSFARKVQAAFRN